MTSRDVHLLGLIMVLLLAISCSGFGAQASPSDIILRIEANDVRFGSDQLTGPARRPFRVVLENRERGIPHNVSIYGDRSAEHPLFVGEVFLGVASMAYDIPPLPAGDYMFRCDIHPLQMVGTLTIE